MAEATSFLGVSKSTSSNSLSPFGAQNVYLGAASQTLLTEVKVRASATQDHALTMNSDAFDNRGKLSGALHCRLFKIRERRQSQR